MMYVFSEKALNVKKWTFNILELANCVNCTANVGESRLAVAATAHKHTITGTVAINVGYMTINFGWGSWLRAVLLVLLALPLQHTFAQSNVELFGQNRVQLRKFDWKYFDTRHFRVYHYDKQGRELGRFVAEEAEYDMAVVEKKLGGQFPPRFNIIIYNTYDEYRQSNIGLKDEAPNIIGNTRAGSLKIVDDKLVVYFTGSHADMRRQMRSGMSLVVMQRMLYGDNMKKAVKNSLLLNLPTWVTDGYIAHLVDGWDPRSNSEWKSIMDAYPRKGFFELAEQYPELAGKAFWKFVSDQFGPGTVKTLLYSMQQKTSINKAMLEKQNLNMKVTKAYDSCMKYYRAAYKADGLYQSAPDSSAGVATLRVPKDNNSIIRNIKLSPGGEDAAYVAWKEGKYQVLMQRNGARGKEPVVLLEGGVRDLTDQIDPGYPMMAWSHSGSKLAILYMRKGRSFLKVYNNTRGRQEHYKIPPNRFDRVLSISFTEDDGKLVLSAIRKSQSDLYLLTLRGTKVTNITDDVWDDLAPECVSGGDRTGILFLSNRPRPHLNVPVAVNELPAGPVNVFFYRTSPADSNLLQCSNVTKGRVSQPIQYGNDMFAYLYDSNGINNRFVVTLMRNQANRDSAVALPETNYNSSIISHQYSQTTGAVGDVVQVRNKLVLYTHEPSKDVKELKPSILSIERPEPVSTNMEIVDEPDAPLRHWQDETPTKPKAKIKGGSAFQSEFDDVEDTPALPQTDSKPGLATDADSHKPATPAEVSVPIIVDSSVLTVINDSAYLKMKPAKYRASFKPDFLSVKLDNSVLFNQYQSIAANNGNFSNPSMGALTTISLNELLENQRVAVGFQLPLNRSYSAYYVQYQNYTGKIDWGLTYYRRQNKDWENVVYVNPSGTPVYEKGQLFKTTLNMVQADFSRPIDRRRSVRFHTGFRQDHFVQKITDTLSLALDFPNKPSYSSMSRLEYVFDNTITPILNIPRGTRYKIYTEFFQGLNGKDDYCVNIGVDVRNYQKLYKGITLANRLAVAHSGGTSKVQYLMGGVDNWIRPDRASGGGSLDGYGFQTLATSFRGYLQAARIGNNFSVLSTEVRIPIVATFVKRPVKSTLLKSLQLVPFVDVGTAWTGLIPDADALSPTRYYPQSVAIGSQTNVLVAISVPMGAAPAAGYGAGLRSSLFGYFLRLDVAYNTDGIKKPIVYLALGTDF